jgi:DUF2971 family protein
LSQWRGYGVHGGRYCIGFDPEKFSVAPSALLHRAAYDVSYQECRIRDAVNEGFETYEYGAAANGATEHFVNRFAGALAARIIRDLCSFKHPGFHEEREWRLVHEVAGHDEHVKFATTRQGITPDSFVGWWR